MQLRLRGSTTGTVPGHQRALAAYLHKEQDLGLVEDILTPFETKNPLKWALEHPEMFTLEMRNLCQPVADSAHYLMELFTTITVSEPFLDGYKFACFPLILSRWASILGWLQTVHWIRYANYRGSLDDAGNEVFRGFGAVVASYLGTDCGEELYSMPCTTDFLYFALRQLDFWKGKSLGDEMSYIILNVTGDFLKSDATPTIFSSRFGTLSKAARRGIVSSLLSRVKDFGDPKAKLVAWAPHAVSLVATVTNSLINTNPSALKLFRQHNFDLQYSSALCSLVKKAITTNHQDEQFWRFVASASVGIYVNTALSPDRGNAIATAVEAGLLFCGFACLRKYPGTAYDLREAFIRAKDSMDEICHRYLCISRVYSAVAKWRPQLEDLLPALKRLKGLEQLCSVYVESFSQSSGAFNRPGIPVPCNHDIVSRRRSIIQTPNLPLTPIPLDSRSESKWSIEDLQQLPLCRILLYSLSRERLDTIPQVRVSQAYASLQRYVNICVLLPSIVLTVHLEDQLSNKTWASRQMRQDRLAYIDLLLNSLLAAGVGRDPRISLEPTHVVTFELRTYVSIGVAKFSAQEWQTSAWNCGSDAEVWLPRCESFIKDMKTNNTIRIAEFVFFNDPINVEVVLVKVREQFNFPPHEGFPSPQRYSVLSTISRIWYVVRPLVNIYS
jgi:hypothetical protein